MSKSLACVAGNQMLSVTWYPCVIGTACVVKDDDFIVAYGEDADIDRLDRVLAIAVAGYRSTVAKAGDGNWLMVEYGVRLGQPEDFGNHEREEISQVEEVRGL